MSLEILTQRAKLRLITIEDSAAIHSLHTIPEVDAYNTLGIPSNIEETKAVIIPWIKDNAQYPIKNYTFVIEKTNTNVFMGLFGLKLGPKKYKCAEVWYKIHPEFWNKGIATAVLREIIAFSFESLDLHRIEAGCAVNNMASIKVLEKAGMTQEGRRRQILPLASGWSDNFEYAILDSDPLK